MKTAAEVNMTGKLKIYAEGGIHYIDSDISGWKCGENFETPPKIMVGV